ncbi:MAG: discoidin domain-containing protein, partial [Proteus hauseri]|nr:discoidin domain-containing protein [Proteus hauseri]
HANEIWESAFNYLQPEVKDSYLTIARNVANAPGSSRVPGFNESEYLKEKLDAVQKLVAEGKPIKDNQEAKDILAEFDHMISAVKDFKENCANEDLVKELEPWLKSLDDLAHAGKDALGSLFALEEKNSDQAWEKLSSASQYYDTMYTYLTAKDLPNVYAKAGSKRLAPFISKVISAAKNQLIPILNPDDNTVSPTLYAKMGGEMRAETTDSKKMYDGDETTFATWKIVQQAGDYYGLDLGRVINITDVSILQAQKDGHHDKFHDAVLQYSEDGEEWKEINAKVEGDRITANGLNIKARYVRYYLKTQGTSDKKDYWTYVREFTVNKKVATHDRVYTNVESLKQTPLTLEGTEISVRNLDNVTLQPGQYIGIKLDEPGAVTKFVKDISDTKGLAFEYSYDELQWTDATEIKDLAGVRYVRLKNSSQDAVQVNINRIGMDVKSLKPEPKLLQATIPSGLKEGTYADIFDDSLGTYILTSKNAAKDTYMTFDLGKTIEVHDVTAVTTDGPQRLYNAKIQISQNNRDWVDVAKVEGDNSEMVVPYRYVRGDGNGQKARYLRVYFTENSGNPVKLHEIQINKKVEGNVVASQITSNMSGDLGAVVDNDISTMFTQKTKKDDYIKYRISENADVSRISVLQGKKGSGTLYVKTSDGVEKKIGDLNKLVSVFEIKDTKNISEVLIKWDQPKDIAIHELCVSKGETNSDDIGQYVDPIIVDDGEEVEQNIAIGKKVEASGTSDGNKDYVNDANAATKWDSDYIKGPNPKENSWIYIDLGAEKEYTMNQIVVRFYKKIYPTKWKLQTSDDAKKWTTVKELSKNPNGAEHPVETIDLETPLTARYVRLFFEELNSAAAGNGVGITEFEIYGKEKKDEVTDKTALNEAIKEAEGKAESKEYTKASKESLKAAIAEAKKVAENASATQDEVTKATTKLQEAVNALQVKVTEKQNIGLKKPVTVSGTSNGAKESINDGNASTKWDSDLIKSGTGDEAQDIGDA